MRAADEIRVLQKVQTECGAHSVSGSMYIKCVSGVFTMGLKCPVRAHHLPQSNAEVKNKHSHISTPPNAAWQYKNKN